MNLKRILIKTEVLYFDKYWIFFPIIFFYECGTKYLKNPEQIRVIKNCNLMQIIYFFSTMLSLKYRIVEFDALLYLNLAIILGYFGFTYIGLHKAARVFLVITSVVNTALFILMDGMRNFFCGYYLLILANIQFYFIPQEKKLKITLVSYILITALIMAIFLFFQTNVSMPQAQILYEFFNVFLFSQLILIYHNQRLLKKDKVANQTLL